MTEFPDIAGYCPMGCGQTLFRAAEGHITCSYVSCPDPCAVDKLLCQHTEHLVFIDEDGYTIQHPLKERVQGMMHNCEVWQLMRSLVDAPLRPGAYEVLVVDDRLVFRETQRTAD